MTINTVNSFLTPIIVSIVSIGVYQALNETLNVADILMAISLFQLLQEPFLSIPYSVTVLNETYTSLNRIEVIYSLTV